MNKSLASPLVIAAGILGLIQGLAWTIFSVLCICCHTNVIGISDEVNENSTDSTEYYKIIYSIFLSGGDEQNPSLNSELLIKPKELYIFMWFYLVFSVVWSCLSGTIIWAMIHSQWHLSKCLFGAWSGMTILISVVDIILTSLIASDYANLESAPQENLVCYGIVMSLAARGYILWVVNVIFAGIIMKFAIDAVLNHNKESTIPIIHGYETSDVNPPWFNNSVKDFWENSQSANVQTKQDYDNHGFQRSQSFSPTTIPVNNIYAATPSKNYDSPIVTNNQMSFSEAIANRTATIGKNRRGRSPLHHVSPPIIPEPDYTPPGTPNELKSVLRAKSNYNQ